MGVFLMEEFSNSELFRHLELNDLSIPTDNPLPDRTLPVPYNIVADDAFPLKPYLLKPFPRADLWNVGKRVFNYRLSRARRTVENAFGILSSRFRIFNKPILLDPLKVEKIVLACCALHNFLSKHQTASRVYRPETDLNTCTESDGWVNFSKKWFMCLFS